MPIYDSDDDVSMASSVSFYDGKGGKGGGGGDGRSVASTIGTSTHRRDDPEDIQPAHNNKTNKKLAFGKNEKDRDGIFTKETSAVFMSKIGVAVLLVVFTFIFAIATYSFTKKQQEVNFESSFDEYANQLVDLSVLRIRHVYEIFTTLSFQATAYAVGTNSNWPFVTLPKFEAQASIAMVQSMARIVAIQPLVTTDDRAAWESYTQTYDGWMEESWDYYYASSSHDVQGKNASSLEEPPKMTPFIWRTNPDIPTPYSTEPFNHEKYHAPVWQIAPIVNTSSLINYDVFAFDAFAHSFDRLEEQHRAFERYLDQNASVLTDTQSLFQPATLSEVTNLEETENVTDAEIPESFMAVAILRDVGSYVDGARDMVAVLTAFMPWDVYFQDVLPDDIVGMILVVRNSCGGRDKEGNASAGGGGGQVFSFELSGPNVTYLGPLDAHDWFYDDQEIVVNLTTSLFGPASVDEKDGPNPANFYASEDCRYTLHLFPSDEMKDSFTTVAPIVYTGFVVFVFVLTAGVFTLYDWLMERRQGKVIDTAARSNAIVSSLFPEQVKGRLMAQAFPGRKRSNGDEDMDDDISHTTTGEMSPEEILNSRPIADLFPDCTVLFADIAGFTAWSSEREPHEVFTLLEFVYNSFDKIARRLKVFKVETIGDSYVAVVGLPEENPDHALVMTKFARACMTTMTEVVYTLELTLGPGTSDLAMRFGLHSGPVTAGVLRGDKSRFQLFGDTVNTAARMESSGQKNKIHISPSTKDLLVAAGKSHWIKQREAPVSLKGKGEMQTYWVKTVAPAASEATAEATDDSSNASYHSGDEAFRRSPNRVSESERRLVVWNVEMLQRLLKKIVAMRAYQYQDGIKEALEMEPYLRIDRKDNEMVLDEMKEIIALPSKAAQYKQDPNLVELNPEVAVQLTSYVTAIASMYNANAFHSFNHASHVTQSVIKMLSRIVAAETPDFNGDHGYTEKFDDAEAMHDNTYGITSDPLTQFAVAFAALIHDVDHPGVSNAQLINEGSEIAMIYRNKSIAEQNSVDIAWDLLMEPQYNALRACIYSNRTELERFRQLVVNSVMATDIADKELGQLRKNRWDKAFHSEYSLAPEYENDLIAEANVNRKATIVIEHLIQASDIAHTMQHWTVYIKWNEKLFQEMYEAFCSGRAEKNPADGWYEGEIGFFNFYIIPLAKKLKECGVFGVSCEEFLNYAEANRDEWEKKGQDIVKQYLMKYDREHQRTVRNSMIRSKEIQDNIAMAQQQIAVVDPLPPPRKERYEYNEDEMSHVPSIRPVSVASPPRMETNYEMDQQSMNRQYDQDMVHHHHHNPHLQPPPQFENQQDGSFRPLTESYPDQTYHPHHDGGHNSYDNASISMVSRMTENNYPPHPNDGYFQQHVPSHYQQPGYDNHQGPPPPQYYQEHGYDNHRGPPPPPPQYYQEGHQMQEENYNGEYYSGRPFDEIDTSRGVEPEDMY